MECRDERPGLVPAHPVRVPEPLLGERAEVADRVLERERLEPRFGQVELHPVLPGRLHPLHGELGEPHRRYGRTDAISSRSVRTAYAVCATCGSCSRTATRPARSVSRTAPLEKPSTA